MEIIDAKMHLSKYRGFPFREHQEEAIKFIIESDKRFVFLEAPTGSGKSLIAMCSGMAMGGVTYAVHSKILQTQITQDFPEAQSLFGRSNYPCLVNEELTCDECFHTRQTPCSEKHSCYYEVQKNLVLASQLQILNYDYLLSEINYVGRFSDSAFNIIDEADNLENTLVNFVTLTFTSYALSRLGLAEEAEQLKKTSKHSERLLESWVLFGKRAEASAKDILRGLARVIAGFGADPSADQARVIKEQVRVKRLLEKITLFLENVDKSWVLDDSQEDRYIFRPLWLTPSLAENFLWRHSRRWVLMSASFLPLHLECKRLGIPIDEVDYRCLPSTFPVKSRPIHIEPCCNLTAKTMDAEIPKLITRVKEIVHAHPNVKGLIHAVSYKLANAIIEGVGSPRLMTHNSSDRQEVLDRFKETDEPWVLVSPSMERGVSFEQDLCRFVIVGKAPFLYLGDRIVAARVYGSKLGSEWYAATMLLSVLQMTGRAMRSADDFCESYILDSQFKRVYESKPLYLPEWWKEGVVWE
jgi:ATP-dependent DNA helicase DinG